MSVPLRRTALPEVPGAFGGSSFEPETHVHHLAKLLADRCSDRIDDLSRWPADLELPAERIVELHRDIADYVAALRAQRISPERVVIEVKQLVADRRGDRARILSEQVVSWAIETYYAPAVVTRLDAP